MIDVCPNQWAMALDETSASVLRRAGIKAPPVSAIELAERLGYAVLWDRAQQCRARIARVGGAAVHRPRVAIYLRPEPRLERVHWAIAHEIGEAYAQRVVDRLGILDVDASPQREQIANDLATGILLPIKWFERVAEEVDHDLVRLKQTFATASHELIARRLLHLPVPVTVSIFDHGQLVFRRCSQPRPVPRPAEVEMNLWSRAHASGHFLRHHGPPRVDIWPIHEPGWKREIIRTELTGDEEFYHME